jgi:hypothetical protein
MFLSQTKDRATSRGKYLSIFLLAACLGPAFFPAAARADTLFYYTLGYGLSYGPGLTGSIAASGTVTGASTTCVVGSSGYSCYLAETPLTGGGTVTLSGVSIPFTVTGLAPVGTLGANDNDFYYGSTFPILLDSNGVGLTVLAPSGPGAVLLTSSGGYFKDASGAIFNFTLGSGGPGISESACWFYWGARASARRSRGGLRLRPPLTPAAISLSQPSRTFTMV